MFEIFSVQRKEQTHELLSIYLEAFRNFKFLYSKRIITCKIIESLCPAVGRLYAISVPTNLQLLRLGTTGLPLWLFNC